MLQIYSVHSYIYIVFLWITYNIIGFRIATLVCPGSNLTLTCLTSGPSLRWVITLPYHYLPEERIISSAGTANSQTPLFENPTLFSFLKTSRVPLVSTILIDNITARLNGTHIDCWFDEGRSTTVLDIVGKGSLIIIVHSYSGESRISGRGFLVCTCARSAGENLKPRPLLGRNHAHFDRFERNYQPYQSNRSVFKQIFF
jgi:hypothetical protein